MRFLSSDFTISKRLLGILMLIGGVLGTVGLLMLDAVRASEQSDIGPAQRIAIIVMILIAVVGLTLIPLGNDPA